MQQNQDTDFHGLQLLMRKRQQLQQYLDAQLERIEGQHPPDSNTFDRLEQKLNQIERKLISLKDHPQSSQVNIQARLSIAEKESKQMRKNQENACQSEPRFYKNEGVQLDLIRIQQQAQITPQKQLNIISKTMSEGHFQLNAKGTQKQSRREKKGESNAKTAKNKQLNSHQKYNSPPVKSRFNSTVKKATSNPIYQHKSPDKRYSQRNNSQKYLNKTHDYQLMHLQKDMEQCMKSNAQLKVKVSQLEAYKTQFCKLKDIISKFERQRKRQKT